ncbi:sperm-associated antigen 5 isoform 1-T2 [Synchiropus picturatus]
MSSNPVFDEEALPSNRCGERTPLRSLGNERWSTPLSWHNSKAMNAVAGNIKDDQENLPNIPTPAKSPQITTSLMDAVADGHGDVTLKSFICDGGEVEISDGTTCMEMSIILPQDQDVSGVDELQSFISDGIMENHVEHPYSNAVLEELFSSDTNEAKLQSPADLDSDPPNEDNVHEDDHGGCDITWKSFACDGGEVEIFDSPTKFDQTIPLLEGQHAEPKLDETLNLNVSVDCSQFSPSKHEDHQYCRGELAVTAPLSTCEEPEKQSEAEYQSSHFTESAGETSKSVNNSTPADQTAPSRDVISAEVELMLLHDDVQPVTLHLDPEFENIEEDCHSSDLSVAQESCCAEGDEEQVTVQDDVSFAHADDSQMLPKISTVPDQCQPEAEIGLQPVQSHLQVDELSTDPEHDLDTPDVNTTLRTLDEETMVSKGNPETAPLDRAEPTAPHMKTDVSHLQPVSGLQEGHSHLLSGNEQCPSSETKDSAFGSPGNFCNPEEKPLAETLPDVFRLLSECPSMASALHLSILSPIVRRASMARTSKDQAAGAAALEDERISENPAHMEASVLWAEHVESNMPSPLFNSTAVGCKPQTRAVENASSPTAAPAPEMKNLDAPLFPDGPLQQQLRQMAEFLLLASGKMAVGSSSALVPPPAPADTHSVCVGTSADHMVDCSLNTSGEFVRKRDFSVADACTLTDPLLWNVSPGSLDCLDRSELEQRLKSSMIMVEALVQQLSVARSARRISAGPPPSELREKLVQTEHTELSQTTMYRDLHMTALKRIQELELDGRSLESLVSGMQDMQLNMASLSSDLDSGLSNMKQTEELIREDHQSLVSHYGTMKTLLQRSKETHGRLMEKVRDALEQKEDMRTRMEDAFAAKEAAFSVVDQLRSHSAREIAELQKSVGSQEELLAALSTTYPDQAKLKEDCTKILNSASDLLHQTLEEQSSLIQELSEVKKLLYKTTPMLLKLNEKAAAAVRERDEHLSEKHRAIEDMKRVEEELIQTKQDLESALEEVGASNLKVTILTSEMSVLGQKSSEQEKELAELERTVTEMSATLSSTKAAHTFLEHTSAAEKAMLLEAQNDLRLSSERSEVLESSLSESEQRNSELSCSLAEAREQLNQLQELAHCQKEELQELQEVCTRLNGVQELNEFLQMENDLLREQMSESEGLLKENLQGLRERNIQCEDLKVELSQLKAENKMLHEDLEATRQSANDTQLQLKEKLAHAMTEVALMLHTLRGVIDELHTSNQDMSGSVQVESRHPSSVMAALSTENEEEAQTDSRPAEPDSASLFSETSAFTRIPVITMSAAECETGFDECNVADLLMNLGNMVTELVTTQKRVHERKNALLEELRNNVCDLQVELRSSNDRRDAEVLALRHQLNRTSSQVELGNQAVEQNAQNEKVIAKLKSEVMELQASVTKHKLDANDLRKAVSELQRSLQQSLAESQVLRSEVKKSSSQAVPSTVMEEKIQLIKEVTQLKLSLQEAEQATVKLQDRAKRLQMIQQESEKQLYVLSNVINKVRETLLSLPHVLKSCEQLQQLVKCLG